MTSDEIWIAISALDPSAEIKIDMPGGWIVQLPNTVYEAFNAMCVVTLPYAPSKEQAIKRMWDHLLSLQETVTLHRDLGPAESLSGRSYEEVQWNDSKWVRIRTDE